MIEQLFSTRIIVNLISLDIEEHILSSDSLADVEQIDEQIDHYLAKQFLEQIAEEV